MIKNTNILALNKDITIKLNSLIGRSIISDKKDKNYASKRGHIVEKMVTDLLKCELNQNSGKDCFHFEIKATEFSKNLNVKNNIKISNGYCDRDIPIKESNFFEKTKLILFVCLSPDGKIVDLRYSNFSFGDIVGGYYKNNTLFKVKGDAFYMRKSTFNTHTISIKSINKEKEITFFDHLRKIERKSFFSWLKSI